MSTLIYLVDDNVRWRSAFKEYLENRFYLVLTAGDGRDETLRHLVEADPAIVVLDGVLPKRDGFEVCRYLRQQPNFDQKGIIMVSGEYIADADQIVGYELGADIYQLKPVDSRLLLAQIKRLEKRISTPSALSDWQYISSSLRYSIRRNEVQKNGEMVKLAPLEFKLILVLMETPNEPVKRQVISDRLEIGDGQINKVVATLRKKIGSKYIQTCHGIGYRIVVEDELV